LASMFFFWIVSGQSPENISSYFTGMAPIISGYTEAMAIDGPRREIALYLLASTFLLFALLTQKQINNIPRLFLFGCYFVFLFLSFKAGFVRHDVHAITSGTSILMAALLLPCIINTRLILSAALFAFISGFYIDSHYTHIPIRNIADAIASSYSSAWNGAKNRIQNQNWPKDQFEATVNSIRAQASFPVLQGTTDIYSHGQSYLISSGNKWSPRPVLQSYSVYTPELAEANRNHLVESSAPDNIIFKMEPIDGRLPALEDGASWPILMNNYFPTRLENDFLFLRKKEDNGQIEALLKLSNEKHNFEESYNLPNAGQPLFARIEITPTIPGRLASIFFKPTQLRIKLELKNGEKRQYRLVAGMANAGFLISPLIENTADFGLLYGDSRLLNKKWVKSMAIEQLNNGPSLWNSNYTITFSRIKTPVPMDITKVYKFDGFDKNLSSLKAVAAEKCEGFIDAVNGMSPAPATLSASTLLNMNGWLAVSVDQGILPEAVYAVLTDSQGKRRYIKTRTIPRPDVGAFLKKPALNQSGFSIMTDISALKGRYDLELAIKEKESDKIKICPQYKISTLIN
jgi:hypothetical protein